MTIEERKNSLVVARSRGKTLFSCIGAWVFVALGVSFIIILDHLDAAVPFLIVLCCLPILFFGMIAIYLTKNLIWPKPAVLVGPQGVTDNATMAGAGLVPWPQIQDLLVYEYMGQRYLGITLKDPDAFFATKNSLKRRLMRINSRMVQAPVN
ncbi:MAG: hypothetical protein D6E12_10540, partial [Desulfovibrio sp.]